MSSTDTRTNLVEAFASCILGSVQEFWFSHLSDPSHIVVPSTEDIKVWFVDKSKEYDTICR